MGEMANSASGDGMIARVISILATFDSERTAQSVSDIARRAGLPQSTAHRIVSALTESGLLERDERGAVRIGLRLWELTTRGSNALGLRQVAMPFMAEVQAAVRQHTQLAVLEHGEVLFIERLSSPDAASNITRIAGRLPLHASSSGLVLLAHAPPDFQERVLAGPLAAISPETITDPAALRRKLAEVRQRGYSFAPGYIEEVATGIAVAIMDGGNPVAALSVVVPRGEEQERRLVGILRAAADGISDALKVQRRPIH
jgi:DNA-binding IclR family transcriptional regulator